jgi:hypothetical protein
MIWFRIRRWIWINIGWDIKGEYGDYRGNNER